MYPLEKIKVLDLSRILAGPWASQFLADLGAEVIKVERPQKGDDTRSWLPPALETLDGGSLSAYFLSANRGKKSIAIDLKTEIGQRIIRALASESDVLIENFKTGNLAKYGLDYSTLKKINPKLIYCSITGFGQTGPYSTFPGYDYVIQAMSGLMSVTGEKNGLPMRVGIPVADLFTGLNAVVGILAALYFRQQTGKGQHIDLALFDTMVSMLSTQNMNYLVGKQTPSRTGIRNPPMLFRINCLKLGMAT